MPKKVITGKTIEERRRSRRGNTPKMTIKNTFLDCFCGVMRSSFIHNLTGTW